jgi:acyl-CoA thioesterase
MDIRSVLGKDRFCVETVGIELLDVEPGRARVKMNVGPEHLNGLGLLQGGATFTLADFALAAASNAHGTPAVSVNASISYFKSVSTGTVYAEAVEESLNTKLGTYTVRVTNESRELIALMQATVYRKKTESKAVK